MDRLPTRDAYKTPGEQLDYTFEWEDWLDGDTILVSNWSVPTGITQLSASNDSTGATVWLTGGTGKKKYRAVNTITTDGGRTAERTLNVHVVNHR